MLLTREFTQEIIQANPPFLLHQWGIWHWFLAKRKNKINRFMPCFKWRPLNKLVNYFSHQKWQGAKTCNLAVFKKDLIQINGFDESFTGWGFEDSDLIVRLMKAGVKRKEARFYAPVIHLWHADRRRVTFARKSSSSIIWNCFGNMDLQYGYEGDFQHDRSSCIDDGVVIQICS